MILIVLIFKEYEQRERSNESAGGDAKSHDKDDPEDPVVPKKESGSDASTR